VTDSDVCLCPEMPVNVWYRDGVEVQRRTLTEVTGGSDAHEYLRMGCQEWRVLCPSCGRVYGTGGRGWWVAS
jgi:hypothetical protein